MLSGHKMSGPSAIGVVYGKKALLDEMPPWQGGGHMIQRVTFEHSTFADPPGRFEAGTAALGPAVGLGAAADYLTQIGMENVAAHQRHLLAYTHDALSRIPGVRLIGTAPEKPAWHRSSQTTSRPKRWASFSTRRGSPFAPGIIARGQPWIALDWRPPCIPRSRFTIRTTKSISWRGQFVERSGGESRGSTSKGINDESES